MAEYLIGFDVGGTKTEATLMRVGKGSASSPRVLELHDAHNVPRTLELIGSRRLPTDRHLGYDHILKNFVDLTRAVVADHQLQLSDVGGIGIALPGSVEPRSRRMVNGNTMVLMNRDIVGDMKRALGIEIEINCANDANCFALAEALCGAGLAHARKTETPLHEQVGLGIILGTGVGGGAVINGRILTGHRGGGAEFGHTILFQNGHPCYCGRSGCAEQYLSGPGIEAAFETRRYAQITGFPTAAEIFDAAENLDPVAVSIVKQYQRNLALFLGNLACLFDPDYFVLGGGMSRQSAIYRGLSENLAQQTFLQTPLIPVYQYAISDSAGAVGAVLTLGWES